MKLKPIPANTTVHTPTEAEAKELLAILHENGYKWCNGDSLIEDSDWEWHEKATCYFISSYVEVGTMPDYDGDETNILTLAEFRRMYCEEEKPQPKFNKGDMVVYNGKPYTVEAVTNMGEYYLYSIDTQECDHLAALPASDLEPYTEPETKPTEDMEAKDETKELNLCELLKGYEGEKFYSLSLGEVTLNKIENNIVLCFINEDMDEPMYVGFDGTARYGIGGVCLIYPTRALYEQYPLDPYTAWMKWQQEQKKYTLYIDMAHSDDKQSFASSKTYYFRTSADRDKCIEVIDAFLKQIQTSRSVASLCEEIKTIIEKYSK